MEIGFHGTVDEDAGRRKKEGGKKRTKRMAYGEREEVELGKETKKDEARWCGRGSKKGMGVGWLKQILNGQPQADIAFL